MMQALIVNQSKNIKNDFMTHRVNSDFKAICQTIMKEDKSLEQWALIESDDMFEKGKYVGGFDATEMEFCFSVREDGNEYWFQISLEEVKDVVNDLKTDFEARDADY